MRHWAWGTQGIMHLPQPQEEAHKTFRCIIEQVGSAGLELRRGPGRTTPNAKRIYGSIRPICLWRLICCGECGCVEEGEGSQSNCHPWQVLYSALNIFMALCFIVLLSSSFMNISKIYSAERRNGYSNEYSSIRWIHSHFCIAKLNLFK